MVDDLNNSIECNWKRNMNVKDFEIRIDMLTGRQITTVSNDRNHLYQGVNHSPYNIIKAKTRFLDEFERRNYCIFSILKLTHFIW